MYVMGKSTSGKGLADKATQRISAALILVDGPT